VCRLNDVDRMASMNEQLLSMRRIASCEATNTEGLPRSSSQVHMDRSQRACTNYMLLFERLEIRKNNIIAEAARIKSAADRKMKKFTFSKAGASIT
jgi:hypothetical protein